MIDTIALAIGHGLLAIALLRLVMREQLDVDPELEAHAEKRRAEREAAGMSGRNARRNALRQKAEAPAEREGGDED